ncbi:MAG: hypothetical protein MRY21_04655 [Simkaniaceae bacterium]|nr:hypothetical protein [Simkaniaceae bacterium]
MEYNINFNNQGQSYQAIFEAPVGIATKDLFMLAISHIPSSDISAANRDSLVGKIANSDDRASGVHFAAYQLSGVGTPVASHEEYPASFSHGVATIR